ncbi:uncharacterized protein LOC122020749 [Zingiber officinale]|uniref:RING-type domain-containing protein n=1 Tax=Zingiber officinale TaxID=94328 RepID=A0A8J5F4S0_ZINOF|nr:uncharacterized protein LOC122020749 [Zingiber officinale]KAG6479026.1 hypothetical protein ZIOFF_062476 [Zingiber officinale]
MEGRELRRSVTLSDQLSVDDSSRLGDLLKIREEEETRFSLRESLIVGPVVTCEKEEDSAADGGDGNGGRTLLDIILQEHEVNGVAEDGNSSSSAEWKTLRDHFLLHSDGASSRCQLRSSSNPVRDNSGHLIPAAASSESNYNSDLADPQPTDVAAVAPTEVLTASELNNADDSAVAEGEEEGVEEPGRVSLMALLEQTDRQWGGSGREGLSPLATAAEDEEDSGGGGAMSYMCCVCMVRHKGAAFIPCGHTFCRTCSRELWLGRGSCPLCNRQILEVLDIF